MEVPLSAPEATETLAAVGHHIYAIFTALEADDRPLEHGDSFKTSLLIESQRFSLWARNLGLYEYGHSSLDYRFRDAPSVYDYTRQLLDKLEKSLLTSMFSSSLLVLSTRIPLCNAPSLHPRNIQLTILKSKTASIMRSSNWTKELNNLAACYESVSELTTAALFRRLCRPPTRIRIVTKAPTRKNLYLATKTTRSLPLCWRMQDSSSTLFISFRSKYAIPQQGLDFPKPERTVK